MKTLENLKKHLKTGHVYRRGDLQAWSKAIDRHLQYLVKEGVLQKMSLGLYYCPQKASFGDVPPDDKEIVRAFLKSNDFLLISPNFYNSLGVRTTQLYNKRVVYNHKRHGMFTLGGKVFDFRLKHKFPEKLTKEFLYVDLLNNLNELAEDREELLQYIKEKILKASGPMKRFINSYGGQRTKGLVHNWLREESGNLAFDRCM